VRAFFYHIVGVNKMYYSVNYKLDRINRDMKLEELIEEVNQYILKKYYLASAKKSIKDDRFFVIIDNVESPNLVLYNKYYCELKEQKN
jgi:hypothetical protein